MVHMVDPMANNGTLTSSFIGWMLGVVLITVAQKVRE